MNFMHMISSKNSLMVRQHLVMTESVKDVHRVLDYLVLTFGKNRIYLFNYVDLLIVQVSRVRHSLKPYIVVPTTVVTHSKISDIVVRF